MWCMLSWTCKLIPTYSLKQKCLQTAIQSNSLHLVRWTFGPKKMEPSESIARGKAGAVTPVYDSAPGPLPGHGVGFTSGVPEESLDNAMMALGRRRRLPRRNG